MTWVEITDEDQLTALVGVPLPRVRDKVRRELHEYDVAWLAASPFCAVGTSAADGSCDVSPKGDRPGRLVHVLGPTQIALAERPGNRRMDGHRNVLANPHIGLNFFIPGRGDTLRINGRARLVAEAPFFADLVVEDKRPVLAVVVDIDEVFHHCAKAFLRSRLWQPETWQPESVVPRRAVLAKLLDRPDLPAEELEEYYGPSYGQQLW